jgi:cellobiose-specific phosphotransferase system component IIA
MLMQKITGLKTAPKILIITVIGALLVVAVFLSVQTGGGEDLLNEAIEAGELTLTSVGRNYESLTKFVQNDEAQAKQLLEAARATLENAETKITAAKRNTSDEYVLGMLDNYHRLAQASDTMAQGVDNLLTISENLTSAIDYYLQRDFEKAAQQASYCLQVLTPLLSDFRKADTALNGTNVVFIPSGQRDRFTLRVGQYLNETEVYSQYILLLRSLLEGKDYLQKNELLEEYMRQLQSAIANKDYQAAENLRQKINDLLQSLRNPEYQNAADLASQLDPNAFGGTTSGIAEELRNRLRNLEGIDAFENYLQSLEKYLEALRHIEEGKPSEAEQAINQGLGILQQGQGGDPELQGLYEGLRLAFNTLQQTIREPPPPG